jgi:hypothetical protein
VSRLIGRKLLMASINVGELTMIIAYFDRLSPTGC